MTIIDFADDIEVTTVAQDITKIEVVINEVIFLIRSWLEEAGMALAEYKIEVVLIIKQTRHTFAANAWMLRSHG